MSVRKRTWVTSKGERKQAWIVDYVDQQGDRHIETFSHKKAADEKHKEVGVDVKKGVHTPASKSITVADAAEDWLTTVAGDQRERTTLEQYKQHVKLHICPRMGRERLSQLTTPRVERLRDDLIKAMSKPMAKKVLGSLKSLLKDARRRGHVAQNVAADTTIKADRRSKKKLKAGADFPLPEEVRKIIEGCNEPYAKALVMVAAFGGLRSSELRGLRWRDVDFRQNKISVSQRADRYGDLGRPKSEAGERTIKVMPVVINVLRELKVKIGTAGGEYVFANGRGNIENHSNLVQRVLQPAQMHAGIVTEGSGGPTAKYTGMHSLRHFYAAWALTRAEDHGLGLTIKELQERMGHATMMMTADTYGHLLPAQDDTRRLEAAERALFG